MNFKKILKGIILVSILVSSVSADTCRYYKNTNIIIQVEKYGDTIKMVNKNGTIELKKDNRSGYYVSSRKTIAVTYVDEKFDFYQKSEDGQVRIHRYICKKSN